MSGMRVFFAIFLGVILGWLLVVAHAAGPEPDAAAEPATAQSLLEQELLGFWYWDTKVDGQGMSGAIELRADGTASERSGGLVPANVHDPKSELISIGNAPREGSWQARFAADGAAEIVLSWDRGEPETYRLFSDGTLRSDAHDLFRK